MNQTKGIVLIMIAATSFGLIPLFSTTAYAGGFNPFSVTLFRFAFAALALFIYMKINKIDYTIDGKNYFLLFQVGLIGYCLMMLTLISSYNYIPTGLATTLHFIYPLAVMLGCIFVYREKIGYTSYIALILSVTGIYFLTGLDAENVLNPIGIILALVSGFLYAYYIVATANTNLRYLNAFVIAFYISLFNTYVMLVICLFTGNLPESYTISALLSTLLLALVCSLIGMVAFQSGLKVITATTASILSTLEPITSLAVGILLLGETLRWFHFAGSVLIIIAVLFVTYFSKIIKAK